MNPVRGYTMLNFLNWLEQQHPDITSLRNLSDHQLLNLVNEFECGKLSRNDRLRQKWLGGFHSLFRGHTDWEGYNLAREKLNLIELRSNDLIKKFKRLGANIKNHRRIYPEQDRLERYRQVALHALFMYTSEDEYVADYILHNWGALDTLSGEYCDIYPSLCQFHNLQDAYDYMEKLTVLTRNQFISYSKLPGIFFWDNSGNNEYISLGHNSDEIKFFLRTIFEEIKRQPCISSVAQAKKVLLAKEFPGSDVNHSDLMQFLGCDEISVIIQILARCQNLQTANERQNFLNLCGLAPVCTLVKLEQPSNQFIPSLLSQLLKVYIQKDSSRTIGLVIFLEFINQIDSSLCDKDKCFIEHIITKLRQSFPQTKNVECLN